MTEPRAHLQKVQEKQTKPPNAFTLLSNTKVVFHNFPSHLFSTYFLSREIILPSFHPMQSYLSKFH